MDKHKPIGVRLDIKTREAATKAAHDQAIPLATLLKSIIIGWLRREGRL